MMDQIVNKDVRKKMQRRLCLTSCIQLSPNKINKRIISRSVESPLEIDGVVFSTRIRLSQTQSSLKFLFGFRTKSNIIEFTKSSLLDFVRLPNTMEFNRTIVFD